MFNHDERGSPMFEVTTVGIDLAKNVSSVHGVDHHVEVCPFVDLPNSKSSRWGGGVTAEEMREMQWVRPELVAQIRFVEWTAEGGCGTPHFSDCARTRARERCGENGAGYRANEAVGT
jgi:hypothetical protein